MNKKLVITAMGDDRPGLVNELSQVVLELGGSIDDSRMSLLGGEFAIILLVSGNENAMAVMERDLAGKLAESGLTAMVKATRERESSDDTFPYEVEVLSMDETGIVHRVTQFFASRGVNIESLDSSTYPAPHSGTPMFSLKMIVNLPVDASSSRIRREFLDLCDDLYIDASLEPVRQ